MLARLAMEELQHFQERETEKENGGKREWRTEMQTGQTQQKKTHIWPYSLYERKMAKIFGKKRKSGGEGEGGPNPEVNLAMFREYSMKF